MIIDDTGRSTAPERAAIRAAWVLDEAAAVAGLLAAAPFSALQNARIAARAGDLVARVRAAPAPIFGVEAFLREYPLASAEGAALMGLAEALLRVSDSGTADRLIRDKLVSADWARHRGHAESGVINAATTGLSLARRVLNDDALLGPIAAGLGSPVIRQAAQTAIRLLARQFVMGRTIEEALARSRKAAAGTRHSYDMLGEAARHAGDAERYLARYHAALAALAAAPASAFAVDPPGISVKLSALHPRYEEAQRGRVWAELLPRVQGLARAARRAGIGFTIDAEEAERLDLSLDLVEALSGDPELAGWDGFGLAVQAYQTRALAVIDHLVAMATRHRRRLGVRLVKGAYWDGEIKRAQERGLDRYPVFSRKAATDVSYLVCAERLLRAGPTIYPGFATHNAHTVAAILELAGERSDWEFQRLHGMGEALHGAVSADGQGRVACRVYAPVGGHEDLLAYLVRRLLENGANASFVQRLGDPSIPISRIIADPVARLRAAPGSNPRIRLPAALYGQGRRNSQGLDLSHGPVLHALGAAIAVAWQAPIHAYPLTGEPAPARAGMPVCNPADHRRVVGTVIEALPDDIEIAIARAAQAAAAWDACGGAGRAAILRKAADLLETERAALVAVIIAEGGRSLADAFDEVREAVDFCRYYAGEAERLFTPPRPLDGPAGEANTYRLAGRGVIACISPWNFPLAIFLGQVTAALAAGNAVVAKPAEQTPLTAFMATRLLHDAGIPLEALHLLPGDGSVGAALVADPRVAGVGFTGSFAVAQAINRTLAARPGPIVPLVAETGGINVLIVDATALAEQVTADVLRSAFASAGQRCSALRVLYLQEEIADRVIAMITGAMAELRLGDPAELATDIGPVIDSAARDKLQDYLAARREEGRVLAQTPPGDAGGHGLFVPPSLIEIAGIEMLADEVFGPVLHVARWRGDRLDAVVDAVNAAGYGLTLGIHSRVEATVRQVVARARIGNIYVNRNMIGAVVGVQPFGGEGLSGTGPKAGGPGLLSRFAVERVVSTNTAATGGSMGLLLLDED